MVHTQRYYLEITTLEKFKDSFLFYVLKKNFDKSFIKLMSCNEVLYEDIPFSKRAELITDKFNRIDKNAKGKQVSILQ